MAKPAKKSAVKKLAAKKAPAKKSPAKKSAVKKPAAKSAAKKAAPKKPGVNSANSAAKQPPAKSVAKPVAKSSAKKSAVSQVTDALKSVANKVTSAFSSSTAPSSDPKKKAQGLKGSDLKGVFLPTDDRLVVERIETSNRTAGGLYIPDTAADGEKPNRGRVLAVGPGHRDKKGRLRPLDVQQGDLVIFDRYAGSEVVIADQKYLLLRESEVVAIEKA